MKTKYFILNQGCSKTRPKLTKTQVVENKNFTLHTKQGLVHKKHVKRKRFLPGTPIKTRTQSNLDMNNKTTADNNHPSSSPHS